MIETAGNVGGGRWLLSAANPNFFVKEFRYHKGAYHLVKKIPGCRVCVIVLKCDLKVDSNNVILRPDLDACGHLESGKHMFTMQIHYDISLNSFQTLLSYAISPLVCMRNLNS